MKKKGLIISTAVMVVVLIAALTTSTFAWFSQKAEASITEFNLQTQAAQGLQIATYRAEGSGSANANFNYHNGDITLKDGTSGEKYWEGALGDFGSSLSISSGAETATIGAMYGASGDGLKMFFNEDKDQKLQPNGKPAKFTDAKANVNFFQLDFVLHSTASAAKHIFIQELNVSPYGDAVKGGMAGSVRIALFATTTSPVQESKVDTYPAFQISDGKFLYDPYGEMKYEFGKWSEGNDIGKYASSAAEYAAATGSNDLKTTWTGKYITGTLTDKTKAPAAINMGPYETLADATKDSKAGGTGNALFDIGEIEKQSEMYLRLVIWFDGEDSACNQTFAGGGVTVKINFSLDESAGA